VIATLKPRRARYVWDVVTHLVAREFKIRYARAFVGWLWAVAEPLARLVVFTFLFQRVLVVEQENFTVFLFTGILAWGWFAGGLGSATASVIIRRDLMFRPGIPRATVPIVSALTDFLDLVAALPVLAVLLLLEDGIPATVWFFPFVLAVQFLLIVGLGYLLCTANVHFRDVNHLVGVVLRHGFYLTPVFYARSMVPERFSWVLTINPMTHVIEAYRAVLIDGELPALAFWATAAVSAVLFVVGLAVFRRASGTFVDEL
jgi:lipopolysaccharide transport system permease protein